MKNKRVVVRLLVSIVVLVLGVAACTGPAESELDISSAWARAAAAGSADMMGEESDADMDSMEPESEDSGEESGMMMHNGNVSAAYMTIENTGNAADRLLAVSTEAAAVVEIHTVEVVDEVARMMPLPDGLEIEANSTVLLEPGGYHIMLIDLTQDLVAGEMVDLVLTFESGKEIAVEAEIREP